MAEDPEWKPQQDQDMSLLCRVCANQHDYLIPIFQGEGLDHDMPTKMDKHLPIKVRETDKLPTQMCYQCASTIIAWSELHTNCLAADKKLKAMLKMIVKKPSTVETTADSDDVASDHYEDAYDDGGGAADDDDNDDEDFEKEIKQLISDAGVELGSKSKASKRQPARATTSRKRKSELTITPVKREPKKPKTEPSASKSSTALLKPKEEVVTNEDRCDLWSCCVCSGKFGSEADLNSQSQFNDEQYCSNCKNPYESDNIKVDTLFVAEGIFRCDYCNKGLPNKVHLEVHIKLEHGQIAYGQRNWYTCKLCVTHSLLFPCRQEIMNHMRVAHQKLTAQVKKHIIKIFTDVNTKSEKPSCDYGVKEDKKNCGIKKEISCDLCSAKYTDKNILEAHMIIEHGKKIHNDPHLNCYSCSLCCKIYPGYTQFVSHRIQVHSDKLCSDEVDARNSIVYSLRQILNSCKYCLEPCLFSGFCREHDANVNIDNCNEHPERHSCEACNVLYSDCNDLWIHLFSQHIDETLYCNLCEKSSNSVIRAPSMLMKHWRRVHASVNYSDVQLKKKSQILFGGEIKYLCLECNSMFSALELLREHLFETHKSGSLTCIHYCDLCDKYFNCEKSLKSHCRRDHSSNEHKLKYLKSTCTFVDGNVVYYKCPKCDIKKTNFLQLTRHITRMHDSPNKYRCSICGANFHFRTTLKTHMTFHSVHDKTDDASDIMQYKFILSHNKLNKSDVQTMDGGRIKYKCPICIRVYTTFYDMKRHFDVHSGERNYPCTLCTKTFFIKARLLEHCRRVHKIKSTRNKKKVKDESGRKKYKCLMCSAVFKRSDSMKVHCKQVHAGERPYTCEVCGTSFGAKKHLTRHYNRSHAGAGFQCNICGRFMCDATNFKDHLDNHKGEKKYTCEICGSAFGYKSSLHHHKFTHSKERLYNCSFCSKKYVSPKTLKEHERTHENVKHTCQTCGNEFNTRKNMLRHMKTHSTERPYVCEYCSVAFKEKKYLQRHYKVHKNQIPTEVAL